MILFMSLREIIPTISANFFDEVLVGERPKDDQGELDFDTQAAIAVYWLIKGEEAHRKKIDFDKILICVVRRIKKPIESSWPEMREFLRPSYISDRFKKIINLELDLTFIFALDVGRERALSAAITLDSIRGYASPSRVDMVNKLFNEKK